MNSPEAHGSALKMFGSYFDRRNDNYKRISLCKSMDKSYRIQNIGDNKS